MAAAGWLVSADGCLRCEEGLRSLAYHPALNAVLAVTDKATVKVIDGTSGTVLQLSSLAAKPGQQISCHYLPGVDKVVFTDGYAVGCRKDLNGILLLDTALQPPVNKQDDHVQLELPLSEAQQLLSVCQKKIDVSGTEGCDDFMGQLREGVKIATQEPPVNHKVAKWATVKICLPHYQLKTVAGAVVSELKRLGLYAAALPVAASLMDRLSYLLPSVQADLGGGPGRPLDRTLMFSEANRRETFTSWPHPSYRWAQPDPMAQAGFYHQPTTNGDDRAMCFTCSVCLVSWEPTDEPWSEHERHSPNCPYVKGEHTQNVPLSVTLATGPAQLLATSSNDAVACLGFGSCPRLLAAATRQGYVCIWDISQQMKIKARFCLNPRDPLIALNFTRTERTSPDEEDSTKPCLTWTDDTSSSSDVPRLESDSKTIILSHAGDSCKDDTSSGIAMEVTALTILQQPERSLYEAGPSTTDGTTKDSRSTGFGVNDRNKDLPVATPLPCLLASALVTSKCTTSLTENSDPISESEPRVLSSGESSPAQVMETGSSLSRGLGGMVSTRTVPLLLVYVVRGIEEKATPLLDALLGKGTPEEEGGAGGTFPMPHHLGVDPEQQPQLFMQEPVHLTYVQQLAQATQGLATTADRKTGSNGAGSNGATIAGTPRPGTLVQCLPLPAFAEAEGMYVQELAPCPDGIHVLALLRPHEEYSDAFYNCSHSPATGSTALFSPNRVEQKNRLNSVLRGEDEGAAMGKYASCTDRGQCGPLQSTVLTKTTENGHFFDGGCGGYCLIYRLGCGGRLATLQPEPVATHRFASPDDTATSMILLPADVLNGHEDDVEDSTIRRRVLESSAGTTGERSPAGSLGHLVITTRVGFIKVIDIGTFETLAVVDPPNRDGAADPFVSLIYCSGTDRLCACTQGGEIHFLQIGETQDDIDSASIFQDGSTAREEKFQDENKHTSGSHNQGLSGLDLLALEPLIADTLSTMLELTRFETLTPRFAATVPPCWAEVQQEQQQRRHPQHLHGQRQGDAAQHTRTWKLHSDSKSWYEHVFEIVLPKVCAVGHVDFKFVLHPDVTSIPPVQVTLLRNRSPGLGKSTVAFPLGPPAWLQASPASSDTSDDLYLGTRKFCPFLEEHKEDILCGPVWLGHGIDLSAHAGTLTLTSPKLICGGKHRSFLLHMHAVLGDKANEEGGRSTNRSSMSRPPAVQGWVLNHCTALSRSGRTESSCRAFDKALLRALLANLSYIPSAATAGALHWYFVLLNYVKEEDLEESSTACASLLSMVSRQLTDRLTPQEALLRARYGLYRSPFDPILFDIEMSGSSYKNAFVVSSSSIQSEEIDLSEIMTGPGRVAVGAAAESSFTALTGLLEVEPLHFGCVATSDGTRVEKDKRGFVFGVVAPAGPPAGAGGTCETNQLLSSAAQAALHSLSTAMASAEQQLQALHEKQQQLLNLQQQKAKLEAKLHQTAAACAAASAATSSTLSSHPMLVFPPTPKTTPLFMTPPLTPPNEVALCSSELLNNGDLAKLYTNSCLTDQSTVLVLQSKQATGKTKGVQLAHSISQASLLLQPPAHQSMVIERMHAGARRFVTLDFGRSVLLTDVLIPACPDLSSLAVDIWARGEEVDGCRLVMAPDIGTHALILHDLLPPPICRFVKITVIGKYGGTNVRAKVPLGLYYGHTYILPWEPEGHAAGEGPGLPSSVNGQPEVEQQLATLLALQEDFQFRYNLACHRLELLLQAVDLPPLSSAAGGHHFLLRPERAVRDDTRVCAAYQACAQLQLQLNLAQHAVRRLRGALGLPPSELHGCGHTDDPASLVLRSSTEQLCTVIKYLLDTLLSLLHTSNGNEVPAGLRQAFNAEACQDLFKHLCLSGTPRIRLHAGLLLAQLCGGEPWWGSFLANVLHELYNSQQLLVFPHDRVFILLSCLGRRSLSNSGVLESLLSLLDRLLSPLQVSFSSQNKAILDIPLVSWVLMLISRLMDCVTSADEEGGASASGGRKLPLDKELERLLAGNQWSFVTNSFHSESHSISQAKISSFVLFLFCLSINFIDENFLQQLSILKAKQKVLVEQIDKEKSQSNKGPSYKLLVEQAKLKQATSKHFKDLLRLRRASEWPRTTVSSSVEPNETQGAIGWEGVPEPEPLAFALAREQCLPVVRKLLAFLLAMDFTCHADLFLFVCKVLARLATCTRPAIYLSDLATETQLERLFMLVVGSDFNKGTVTWGGAWAQHALICMLQDILIGITRSSTKRGTSLWPDVLHSRWSVPPSPSPMDKDKDLDMLQDFSELHVLPFDVDLDEDLHATKVFKVYDLYLYWIVITVDARLEVGLEQQAELALKMMATVAADSVLRALTATSPAREFVPCCFLGSLLHLWLTLSQTMGPAAVVETGSELYSFSACRQPAVPLSQGSISSLLATLAWQPNTSLVTWCLALQSLALMTNLPPSGSESIAQDMVSDTNLVAALQRFLSGRSVHTTSSCQVGPTVLHALQGLLSRLQIHLSSSHPGLFNEFLLRLVHMLSSDSGPFHMGTGPLDAQLKLLDFSLEQSFEAVSVGTILSVIESAAALVHPYIASGERLTTRSGLDGSVASRSCFSGLFGHAGNMRAADSRHLGVSSEVTRDSLVFGLLRLVNLLAPLPLTPDGRQSMKQPSGAGTIFTGSVSDEEKASCGGSREMECIAGSNNGQLGCVADLVLANQQVMSQILAALSQCNSNTMAMIIGASGLHLGKQESLQGGLEAVSVGDGLFCILSTLGQRASSPQLLLQPILTYMACGYMGRQGSLATCQMSEPLLWYILRVLDSTESLKTFLDMGGVQLICNNMVTSTRAMLNTSRSMVSTIMRCLDVGHGRGADGNMRARFLAADTDASEGLHNFAPYGTITSTSPTAQPAEVLLQATPPHRRARSAAWSYIFLPEESWCDLTVHLPAAILLREIHIQPHIASLATCPAAVSVEVSADGVNMLPVASPVVTAGQTYIKLQLVHAEVVTAVCLRLHRPRDSGTLGLSQIKLLGLTAFGCMSCSAVTNPFLPTEDQVSKSSIGWLRLLHHCMTHVADLEGPMASAAAPTANLLQTCAALLVSPYCGMHAPSIEAVLIGLGLQSTSMGLRLVYTLLRDGASCMTHPADLNSPLLMGRLNGLSSDSTVDIVFQLGTTQDTGTRERVKALISWVKDCAQLAVRNSNSPTSPALAPHERGLLAPSPSHVHCIAAVLWYSLEQQVEYDLPGMMGPELFQVVLSWSSSLPSALPLKKAVDWLLCALCHVQPVNFATLLTSLGVPRLRARSSPSAAVAAGLSLTDDTKKAGLRAGQTDDSKRGAALALASLDAGQLATLAAASQSPEATQQLLDSGFPACLARALVDCCLGLISTEQPQFEELLVASKPPSLTARMIAPVLRFFTEVGSSHSMKDWLGGPEGQPMWSALLSLLCHASVPAAMSVTPGTALRCSQLPPADGVLSTQGRSSVENAAVAFFAQCICCHPANQKLMAQVLCELFQTSAPRGNMSMPGTISGFARRLFLQLMLEDENVTVFLQSPCPLYKGRVNAISHVVQHPTYGAGHKFRTMSLTVSATLANVLNRVSGIPGLFALHFSMADRNTASVDSVHADRILLTPSGSLPLELTLAQLLTLLHQRCGALNSGSLDLVIKLGSKVVHESSLAKTDAYKRLCTEKGHSAEALHSSTEGSADEALLETPPMPSPLQVFASLGGLALIGERLPMLYPDMSQQVSPVHETQEHGQNEPEQFEWVSLDPSGDTSTIDFPEFLAFETNSSVPPPPSSSVPTVPPHSLAAFGLFLRLPGYAEVLLRERRHAQRLLRLVLGVVDDGKGNHILQSPSASVLPTLPFQVLRTLLVSTPLTTDDGVLLRRMALDVGALHLLLACLAALSHHSPRGSVVSSSGEEQQLYWAKGTGFGTGSTTSGWDVEQALSKQRMEEEHVTCLLQVLASYINPNSSYPTLPEVSTGENQSHSPLPAVLPSLFSQSCLLPAIASYLRNDSVLDMARHVPLYRALLELLRAMAHCSPLIPLLLPSVSSSPNGSQDHEEVEKHEDRGADEDEEGVEATSTVSQASISALLAKMKICVDTYSSRLRSKKEKEKSNGKAEAPEPEAEGLTLLVPDIQRTADIVQKATTMLQQATRDKQSTASVLPKNRSSYVGKSLQERYIGAMKDLQFDTFEMVVDKNDKPVFRISHHYASQVKTASDGQSAARARRLAQEAVTLSTSLPLSASSSVFVRCDEERLDVMKVLITGPADTPYANGCFEFDVYFPQDYPKSPPLVNLETTGQNSIRFNPNLYNDGKVCLSILNTWHGRPEEKWNPQTSSFLQVLVSIQSLILVAEPYFNEPGYERSRGTPSGAQSSREYDANIRQATVKWAMLEQLCNPSPCFKEVILRHFYLKRMEVMAHCEEWIADIQQYSADKRVGRTMAHHAAALKRHAGQLRDVLLKLQCPEGLEFPEQMNEATGHSWLLGTDGLNEEVTERPQQQSEISGPSWLMDPETEGATGSEGAYGGADFDPVEALEITMEAAEVAADPLPKAYYGP
uniref:Dual E2 ubiquitin-conjugating enzyme/E3 ubiquitin-protein ligase BIRC6 n=1 Tax=Eptatretus burgeri TaxID=7764 RepID=A0A8C4Q1J4_EPTBU